MMCFLLRVEGAITRPDEPGSTKLNHVFALEKVIAFMHELEQIVLAGNRLHQISGFKETFYSGMVVMHAHVGI